MGDSIINAILDIDTTEIERLTKEYEKLRKEIQELKTQADELNSCIQKIDLDVDVKAKTTKQSKITPIDTIHEVASQSIRDIVAGEQEQ